MGFSCDKPYMLYALFLILPALFFELRKYKKVFKKLQQSSFSSIAFKNASLLQRLPYIVLLRIFFRAAAWGMLVFALADFSWGTYESPIQKNGNAVAFVFDISYSMNADDASDGLTRLKASGMYASLLLSHMKHVPVSVTIAKGDGVVVIPFTEDKAVINSLASSLSPTLLTAEGSSLGKGVQAALSSFNDYNLYAKQIWVFTDGDETDKTLAASLDECMKHGVNVSLIGFGSEREIDVLAGDGKTRVRTALRSETLKRAATEASNSARAKSTNVSVKYVDATELGSAHVLLNGLHNSESEDGNVTYEIHLIERYPFFLLLAILFFLISVTLLEYNSKKAFSFFKNKELSMTAMCVCVLFSSCSLNYVKHAKKIAEGSLSFHQKKYVSAIADFLETADKAQNENNHEVIQYALYNLSSSYITQDEYSASINCMKNISNNAPAKILYATYYNHGIASYLNGDYKQAVFFFKEALKINNSEVDAKINLEIALQQLVEKDAPLKDTVTFPADEKNTLSVAEEAIFQRIRENEQRQWKNSEQNTKSNSSMDY